MFELVHKMSQWWEYTTKNYFQIYFETNEIHAGYQLLHIIEITLRCYTISFDSRIVTVHCNRLDLVRIISAMRFISKNATKHRYFYKVPLKMWRHAIACNISSILSPYFYRAICIFSWLDENFYLVHAYNVQFTELY